MALDFLKKVIGGINLDNYKVQEPEEEVLPKSSIYEVMKILDQCKKEDAIKRLYKTDFDYDRQGNTISIIFKVDNFRKASDFDNVFNSEFIKSLFNELSQLNLSKIFLKRIKNRSNYKLNLHGNIGIYQTPYFRI